MKPWPRLAPRFLVLASLVALAGCDSIAGLIPPADGSARVAGKIKDDTGVAVAGVKVSMPYAQGLEYSDITDSKGSYSFDPQAKDFVGISPVAVIVYKDRYLPKTYYLESINDQDVFDLSPDPTDAIRPLATNEFVPQDAYTLWHLGDQSFSGSSNSGLQVASSGLNRGYLVTSWNATTRALYKSATITLVARGIDTNRTSQCANRFGLYIQGGQATSYVAPGNSDANGQFSFYTLNVSLPSSFIDGPLTFAAISGACTDGDAGDDFEFAQVLVKLNP